MSFFLEITLSIKLAIIINNFLAMECLKGKMLAHLKLVLVIKKEYNFRTSKA
jgi:hypothetical protein